MPLDFNKHAKKGNEFLNALSVELGDKTNKARAGRVLRAVFMTLRERLTLEENFQLMAQLPVALKGLYVHNWSPSRKKDISRRRIDFVDEVVKNEGSVSWRDFSSLREGTEAVHAVFKILRRYISPGEFRDIEAVLPHQLKELLEESIHTRRLTIKRITEKTL